MDWQFKNGQGGGSCRDSNVRRCNIADCHLDIDVIQGETRQGSVGIGIGAGITEHDPEHGEGGVVGAAMERGGIIDDGGLTAVERYMEYRLASAIRIS